MYWILEKGSGGSSTRPCRSRVGARLQTAVARLQAAEARLARQARCEPGSGSVGLRRGKAGALIGATHSSGQTTCQHAWCPAAAPCSLAVARPVPLGPPAAARRACLVLPCSLSRM